MSVLCLGTVLRVLESEKEQSFCDITSLKVEYNVHYCNGAIFVS